MQQHIFVLNGPNLNLLGQREPEIYGHDTLSGIEQKMKALAREAIISFRQTNSEGQLVDWVQDLLRLLSDVLADPVSVAFYVAD